MNTTELLFAFGAVAVLAFCGGLLFACHNIKRHIKTKTGVGVTLTRALVIARGGGHGEE